MQRPISLLAVALTFAVLTSVAFAQPGPPPDGGPGFGPPPGGQRGGPRGAGAVNGSKLLIDRMLKFDKNADEQLTLEEVTDQRLHRLFHRADADQDNIVTRAELTTVAAAIKKEFPNAAMRGPGGPGGPRGPRGGPGGFGGPPPGGPPGEGGPPPRRDPPPEQ